MAQATPTRGNAKAEPDGEALARAARSGAARPGSVSRAARSGAARAGSMFGSRRTDTAGRILDATLDAFGSRGYGATSLDDLARDLGIRKQTILYWYPSKEALLDAAIVRTTAELTTRLERAVAHAGHGFDRVDGIVRAVFRRAARLGGGGDPAGPPRLDPPGGRRPPPGGPGCRVPRGRDGRRADAASRAPPDPPGGLLDGHWPRCGGRGAARVRGGAHAGVAGGAPQRAAGAP